MPVLEGETRNQNNMCIDREHWYKKKRRKRANNVFIEYNSCIRNKIEIDLGVYLCMYIEKKDNVIGARCKHLF